MKIPNINLSKLLDPVKLAQIVKYVGNLTVTSNDVNIVPRDDSGNIQLIEESETNPLLIIEPVATKITLDSVLKVIDTRFQYFKFPATTRVIQTNTASIDYTSVETDTVYARYKPSENRKILSTPVFSGILMDEVVEGQIQTNINTYYITKEIKESGANLRFRIKLSHQYTALMQENTQFSNSTVEFSIIKQGPDTELNRQFKGPFLPIGNQGVPGVMQSNEVLNTEIEIIITNTEFSIGDIFNIGAKTDTNNELFYHTINAEQTYWVITDASKNVNLWNQEITNDNTI
jgi:hypothetical protein